jgi:hypothetical protein
MNFEENYMFLESELESVKQFNRRLIIAGLFALVLFVFLLLMIWLYPPHFRRLVSNEFVLKDKNGQNRAKLFMDKDLMGKESPKLLFFNKNGRVRICLSLDESGPNLSFYGKHGGSRFGLWVAECGNYSSAGLSIYDETANSRIELDVDNEDGPSLGFFDKEAQLRARLFEEKNISDLLLFDENGETIWSARN